ncbi:hypothetical protein V1477_012005 [Vespula maculifrons]|uniref:Uncharacterized protein n=1 Tax=Vespula maculifrons TaxID=7453 RepID=A0ABD2C0T9_VESMC
MAPNRFSLGPDRLASDRLLRTAKSSDFCTIYVHSDTRLCMATTTFGIVEAAAAIAAERTHAVDDRVDDGVAREIVCSSKSSGWRRRSAWLLAQLDFEFSLWIIGKFTQRHYNIRRKLCSLRRPKCVAPTNEAK